MPDEKLFNHVLVVVYGLLGLFAVFICLVAAFNIRELQAHPAKKPWTPDRMVFVRSCMNGNTVFYNPDTGYRALKDIHDRQSYTGYGWRRIPHSVATESVCA